MASNDLSEYDYVGEDIRFQEMPQGCVISDNNSDKDFVVVVSSVKDAWALIESLQTLIKSRTEPF
jgi:hypothetical protein